MAKEGLAKKVVLGERVERSERERVVHVGKIGRRLTGGRVERTGVKIGEEGREVSGK